MIPPFIVGIDEEDEDEEEFKGAGGMIPPFIVGIDEDEDDLSRSLN